VHVRRANHAQLPMIMVAQAISVAKSQTKWTTPTSTVQLVTQHQWYCNYRNSKYAHWPRRQLTGRCARAYTQPLQGNNDRLFTTD